MSDPVILVTGGRDYQDALTINATLTEIAPGLVVHGGARGADMLADAWARRGGVHVCRVDALWHAHGKGAGPRRNAVMVEICRRLGGLVVAFPGGVGTEDCVARAERAGLAVRRVGE